MSDEDKPPYLQFRVCKKRCYACNECGYFWGPGHDKKAGQRASWSPEPKKPTNGEDSKNNKV